MRLYNTPRSYNEHGMVCLYYCIIIIIIIISFMQGIPTYIPETNHSLGNKVFQLICHYYLWCLYR